MTLGPEVVDFIWLKHVEKFDEVCGVTQITVVEKKPHAVNVGILIEMVDALSVESACTTDDAVHFISFLQEELSEVRTILASDTSDESFLQCFLRMFMLSSLPRWIAVNPAEAGKPA